VTGSDQVLVFSDMLTYARDLRELTVAQHGQGLVDSIGRAGLARLRSLTIPVHHGIDYAPLKCLDLDHACFPVRYLPDSFQKPTKPVLVHARTLIVKHMFDTLVLSPKTEHLELCSFAPGASLPENSTLRSLEVWQYPYVNFYPTNFEYIGGLTALEELKVVTNWQCEVRTILRHFRGSRLVLCASPEGKRLTAPPSMFTSRVSASIRDVTLVGYEFGNAQLGEFQAEELSAKIKDGGSVKIC